MSVKVSGLTKNYGGQKALDRISFEAKEGDIVGLLGPNGAGKSTTMKIVACYLPPDDGSAEVYGYDIRRHSLDIRRIIGYLPEHNPMYLDMYVHEYLRFIGSLYGLKGRRLKARVEETVLMCGLAAEQNKKIEALSKGYRQRVGLAQALIHDPKTLILDEPTTGLDPNQIVDIRNLIRNIAKEKTVIFSSHIMQEVEALCHRAIIINKGRIVAEGSVTELRRLTSGDTIAVEFSGPVEPGLLESVEGVREVHETGKGLYRLIAEPGRDVRPGIFRLASEKNLPLLSLHIEEGAMESVFQRLTKENG